jgi:hypothetical protein
LVDFINTYINLETELEKFEEAFEMDEIMELLILNFFKKNLFSVIFKLKIILISRENMSVNVIQVSHKVLSHGLVFFLPWSCYLLNIPSYMVTFYPNLWSDST